MKNLNCIAFAYAKDSPLLRRYLEINGIMAVQVWRTIGERNQNQVALVRESAGGWPEDWRLSLRNANAMAIKLAEHCGLPILPAFI